MLHLVGSRTYPYVYGSISSPSQARLNSSSVQRRLPTPSHALTASRHETSSAGTSPFRLGHSYRSTQYRIGVRFFERHSVGCLYSRQRSLTLLGPSASL